MTPLVSTLAALTADQLIAYNQPPAAVPPPASFGSYDPTGQDMSIGSYDYVINRAVHQSQDVDHPNSYAYGNFFLACKNWELGGKTAPIPSFPGYVTLDSTLFDKWWLQLAAEYLPGGTVTGEPPHYFVVPYPQPPPVVIVNPAPVPIASSPIGQANGGVFMSSNADNDTKYPPYAINGVVQPNSPSYSDATLVYRKYVWQEPMAIIRYWVPISALPAPTLA